MAQQLEIKKMKQGMSYSCKEKTIILNVFKYFRTFFPDKCVTEIVRRTAKATGCSEKSVFQFRKEEASAEGFKVPSTTKIRRNININSRDIKYDNTVRQAIRHVIYDLRYKNIVPSLNTIMKQVNSDPNLPNFSLMTLRRLLFDMGFSYEKNGNKSVLVEKPLVKKETSANKTAKKTQKTQANHDQDEINKPQIPQSQVISQQSHRIMPMHVPQTDNSHVTHVMPSVPSSMHLPPPHNMPMMLNRMPHHHIPPSIPPPPPPNMNMPTWLHHSSHAMMKHGEQVRSSTVL